jgi:2-polyprenyl-3-methyl-5-hydroxy-6-metoxy-1,4-benzoquinol methylase
MSGTERPACKICAAPAMLLGVRQGTFKPQSFEIFRCDNCGFAFVNNPWLDYKEIYSEAYYKGQGADRFVDYLFELHNPTKTVRQYEWRGIVEAVRSCMPLRPDVRWLDFGCGNGGLVRHCLEHLACSVSGYEDGWIRDQALNLGIPLMTRDALDAALGTFDIVTAIEVVEHLVDPLMELRLIRSLLKPGGLLLITTGNAAPHRERLFEWGYFLPEVHVSLFEPRTLARALRESGFRAEFKGYLPGFDDIIRFKVLKSLGFHTTSPGERALPWKILSRIVNKKSQVTAHPIGWAE